MRAREENIEKELSADAEFSRRSYLRCYRNPIRVVPHYRAMVKLEEGVYPLPKGPRACASTPHIWGIQDS